MERKLTRAEFDAIVTGELTHHIIWLEAEIEGLIMDHFVMSKTKSDFERVVLRGDRLTFQGKIEICRGMLPLYANQVAAAKLRPLLSRVEDIKAKRNALAHGRDVTPPSVGEKLELHVEIVSRSGKERTVVITPATHDHDMAECEEMLKQLQGLRAEVSVT
jgi:hypothetical protein